MKNKDHQVKKGMGRSMGSTSDGHMVPNKAMKKSGDKMPKSKSKKGY